MSESQTKWQETLLSGLGGAVIGGVITIAGQWAFRNLDDVRNAEVLRNSLCTEVRAEEDRQRAIMKGLEADLAALIAPGDPLQRSDGPQRRWLIPPVSTSFPVFDLNVSRLGELKLEARNSVYEYFELAKQFRTQINLVSGTAIAQANYPERVDAVAKLNQMLASLQAMAPNTITVLGCANVTTTLAK